MSETTGKTYSNARELAWQQTFETNTNYLDVLTKKTADRQNRFANDSAIRDTYYMYKRAWCESETTLFIDLFIYRLETFLKAHKAGTNTDVSIDHYDRLIKCINRRLADLWAAGVGWESKIITVTNLRNAIKTKATSGLFKRETYFYINQITPELRYEY